MSALICGSVAYDTVMVFPGRFRDHILPDKIHMLNVAFLVPSMKRNFGGCAGNIAYNLGLLGGQGAPMATVGHDFGPYQRWAGIAGISLAHVKVLEDEFTAQATAEQVLSLLSDTVRSQTMRQGLAEVRERLGGPGASRRAAEAILRSVGVTCETLS